MRPAQSLFAGDTVEFNELWDGYGTDDGYTLHYRLINGTGKQDFNGVDDGAGGWDFTVNATFSNFAASGNKATVTAVIYAKLVSDPTQITTLLTYGITLYANAATATTLDARTPNRIALDNAYDIRNTILADTSQSRAAFGRVWTYKNIAELEEVISGLERKVRAEEDQAAIDAGQTVHRGTYFAKFINT